MSQTPTLPLLNLNRATIRPLIPSNRTLRLNPAGLCQVRLGRARTVLLRPKDGLNLLPLPGTAILSSSLLNLTLAMDTPLSSR